MKVNPLHRWDVSREEAVKIQHHLRRQVLRERTFSQVSTVAGVDVGLKNRNTVRAAIVVLSYPQLAPIDQSLAELPVSFPYVPGLLAFREAPVVLAALEKLETEPDLFICDGQGFAHPRRLGIATHLGLVIDKPSIGCAKSRLCGTHRQPAAEAGSWVHLYDGQEVIGAVVRTRTNVQPLYVSIGHKIDLESAIDYVLNCCRGYRLPETTRYAHRVAGGEKLTLKGSQLSLFDL